MVRTVGEGVHAVRRRAESLYVREAQPSGGVFVTLNSGAMLGRRVSHGRLQDEEATCRRCSLDSRRSGVRRIRVLPTLPDVLAVERFAMGRRLIVAILLLALAWQGPVLAYSASLAAPMTTSGDVTHCFGVHEASGNACDGCCSHSRTCATACTFSLAVLLPTALSLIVVAVPHLPAPNAPPPALVDRHPARLLRPPIA